MNEIFSLITPKGANIIRSDGRPVGDGERLFIEPDSNKATHFVISQGQLLKNWKVIPANFVESVAESKIHVIVSSQFLESLPVYAS